MTESKIALKLNDHEHEIKSAKHRLDAVEKKQTEIETLTLSVNKLAINMEHMLKEQQEQGKRLKTLENEPADNMKALRKTIISSVITCVLGAIIGAVLALIIH